MRVLRLILVMAIALRAEIIDRIAVTLDTQVITESEVLRQMRLTAFLNDEPVSTDAASKRRAAERIVEQMLIRREMQISRYPGPTEKQVLGLLEELKQARFRAPQSYLAALEQYHIREKDLLDYLRLQATVLRFIETRFRPAVQIPEQEMREYYEATFLPRYRNRPEQKAPPFDEVRQDIEQILTAQRADQALDRWLGETRTQTNIRFQQEVFR